MRVVDTGLAVEIVNVAAPPVRMLLGATERDTDTLEGVGVGVPDGVGVGVGVPPELNAV